MSALTLTGAIPGLLRRGSPVAWRDEETPFVVVLSRAWPTPGPVDGVVLAAPAQELCLGVQDDPSNFTLDLSDPTGRYHALLWLRERGHDLRWAEDEAEVLAWSVLSVARGGGAIEDIIPIYVQPHPGTESFIRRDPDTAGPCCVYLGTPTLNGWGWWFKRGYYDLRTTASGPETGDLGRAAADRAALVAGYALRNEDGTLTLPPLPGPKPE